MGGKIFGRGVKKMKAKVSARVGINGVE